MQMTFDDDFIRVPFWSGHRDFPCKALKIDWPPPARIGFFGVELERVRMSEITDEQRQGMTHVCRGAEYRPVDGGVIDDKISLPS